MVDLNYTPRILKDTFFIENEILKNSLLRNPHQSISWADTNEDNWVDILIGNKLWQNNLGSFQEPIKIKSKSFSSVFIDFDNDYDMDILSFTKNGLFLFENDKGEYNPSKQFENLPLIKPNAVYIADYNNDKFPDLLVLQLWSKYPKPLPNYLFANYNGKELSDQSSSLYPHHDGISNFPYNQNNSIDSSSLESEPNIESNKRSRAGRFIDYDLDGDQDIYIANYFLESDELYDNLGNGEFKLNTSAIDSIISASSKCHDDYFNNGTGISWSDFDNDGDYDYILSQLAHPILITEFGHLGTTIFKNDGGQWVQIDDNAGIKYEETHAGVIFSDIDNDGLEDLIIAAFYDCKYLDVYIQKDDNTFEMKTFESGLNKISGVHDICVVDYNNDGMQDICFVNDNAIRLFENKIVNQHNWLKIKLKGKSVNAYGIGTTVKLVCGDDTYMKNLYSGNGQLMQSPPILHFGIAKHDIIDKIEIYWDDEKIQILENIKPNNMIEIVEN